MTSNRVVYTCLFGGYETLLDQPVAGDTDIAFVAFTDDPATTSESWDVRLVPAPFPSDQNRSSRRAKILPHEYLDGFEESLYIDNTVLLTVAPERVFDELLPADVPMALVAHSYRGPVREEFEVVVRTGRDIDIVCGEQMSHYEQVAPGVLDAQTMWGGFLLRRHHDPAVRAAMQTWWEHVLRYSRRDQLSLPFALATSGLAHHVHRLDNRESEYHVWPREGVRRDPAGGAPADIAAGLRAETAEARADAAGVRAELAEARARLDVLTAEAATAAVTATNLQAAIAAERARGDAAEAALVAVHDSTSWRVTEPLRSLSTPLRTLSKGRRASAATRSDGQDPR